MKKPISLLLTVLLALAVLTACCSESAPESSVSPEATQPTETTAISSATTLPVVVNEYAVVETFVELYNAAAAAPIAGLVPMDIHGEDYRTEFRLSAFDDTVGQKGTIADSSIQIIHYVTWSGDGIRIYADAASYDTALEIVHSAIHVLDNTITDGEIEENISRSNNIVLGPGGYISGYLNKNNDGTYEIMIDCSDAHFPT